MAYLLLKPLVQPYRNYRNIMSLCWCWFNHKGQEYKKSGTGLQMSIWLKDSISNSQTSLTSTRVAIYSCDAWTCICLSVDAWKMWVRSICIYACEYTCVPYVWVYICSPMAGNQSQISRILLCSSSYHCLETWKRVYWMCCVCTCGDSAVGRAVYSGQQGVKFNLGVNFMARNSGEENSYCITEVLGSPFYCGYHGYHQHAKIPS